VPLPARYGVWAVPGGVAVEVVVRLATLQARRGIETSLQEQGVPVQELHLREDRSQLQHPIPLRGDLREHTFSTMAGEASLLQQPSQELPTGGS
jgi:hypothetical protein